MTEETTETPVQEDNNVVVYEADIDYRPYIKSVEDKLSDIQSNLNDYQSSIESRLDEIYTESFFDNEEMDIFLPYANTSDIANLLFGIVIMLGLIFGALVFRHFRK